MGNKNSRAHSYKRGMWKETCVMDERMAMLRSWVSGDYSGERVGRGVRRESKNDLQVDRAL